ncbi:hypothetical protein Baya_0697 [Bagarius yarrelli]|uniref:Uncharacterized protein n=1 Tax=Bagarius yarrelli TaxID=175774 RepID=A0A556TIZ9_BAGYA|nr:hypothetical protein Baya_0697 [Bagarius yarrelli]
MTLSVEKSEQLLQIGNVSTTLICFWRNIRIKKFKCCSVPVLHSSTRRMQRVSQREFTELLSTLHQGALLSQQLEKADTLHFSNGKAQASLKAMTQPSN